MIGKIPGLEIGDLTDDLICGYRDLLAAVASERKYLCMTEAPPLESSRPFAEKNRSDGLPAIVALLNGRVAGWSDIFRPLKSCADCKQVKVLHIPGKIYCRRKASAYWRELKLHLVDPKSGMPDEGIARSVNRPSA